MLSLSELKGKLLRTHHVKSKELGSDEYDTGFLAGLESVLLEIDRAMEDESERMSREYEEDKTS